MAKSPNNLSYVNGGTLEYEPSVFSHFARTLESSADKIAIRVVHQQADYLDELRTSCTTQPQTGDSRTAKPANLSWTYEQLHHAALQVVESLRVRGVTAGSTVVCLVPNGVEWAIVLWASLLGKFTLCSLDFGALSAPRANELQMLLRRIKPDVVFVLGENGANAIDDVLGSESFQPKVKIMFQSNADNQGHSAFIESTPHWNTLRDMAISDLSQPAIKSIEQAAVMDEHSRIAFILFTSGTTLGTPKGCPHTVRGILHAMNQNWDNPSPVHPRRLLQTANFRIIAPSLAIHTWAEGGAVILPSAVYDPQAMLAALSDEDFAINFALFIPAQLHAIVAQDNFAAISEQIAKRGDLKVINLGGDIITEDLYSKARKAFPNTNVRVGHGMTEAAASVTWPNGLSSPPFYQGIAPVGKPNDGSRLKIAAVDTDHNSGKELWEPLKRNEVGELHLWNESVIRGYLDGINAHDFYTDGSGQRWFHTGDMGFMNDDGWVYLLSRKKDIIKRAGIPITPAAIETTLDTYLSSHTCVIGAPHPTLGQEPVAVVKSLGQFTKGEVKQHILKKFGRDYGLGHVFTLQELGLDEYPLNATGKILKRDLLERIASPA